MCTHHVVDLLLLIEAILVVSITSVVATSVVVL